MLETEGVTAAVAADGELSAAVDEVAASLAQCTLEEIGRLDVKSMVAPEGRRPAAGVRGVRRFLLDQHARWGMRPGGSVPQRA